MNDILRFTIPEEIYIDDELLYQICEVITEEFGLPEEILPQFGISVRYLAEWKKLAARQDPKAVHIINMMDYAVKRWIQRSRKKVLGSRDIRTVHESTKYWQDRMDIQNGLGEVEEYTDDWID